MRYITEHFKALRQDDRELARATRPGCLTPLYQGMMVYSLTVGGVVRQGMTFRNDEENYTHGSMWNVVERKVSLDTFRQRFGRIEFQFEVHRVPRRVNFNKPIALRAGVPLIERRMEKLEYQAAELRLELMELGVL